jgi:predicted flap endonuclease-1-like 5' DNA nuclease
MSKMPSAEYFMKDVLSSLAADQQGGWPWWAWVLLIIVLILIFLILWLWWRSKAQENIPAKPEPPIVKSVQKISPQVATTATVATPPLTPVTPDDLTIIEGIGPKIASTLQTAGIKTFTQLAGADIAYLNQVLKDAELRLANPGSWSAQAKLAADGKWDELKTLQDSLKGGRVV